MDNAWVFGSLPAIKQVQATELLDSRGRPTIGCQLILEGGYKGLSVVPSGASTGSHEAHEKRDQDFNRYKGKGVLSVVSIIEERIAAALLDTQPQGQRSIDTLMCQLDGCDQKTNFGANAILAVSLAYAKACAEARQQPLYEWLSESKSNNRGVVMPVPFMNMINGGRHAHNDLAIQEFMVVPYGMESFAEAVRCGSEIMGQLENILLQHFTMIGRGDEGGFSPHGLQSVRQTLDILIEAIETSGYNLDDVGLAIDCAAGEYQADSGGYSDLKTRIGAFDNKNWIDYWSAMVKDYPLISLEDPCAEDDWSGWQAFTKELGNQIQLVGDDLFVTQVRRLTHELNHSCANAVLLKPNQVGSITELFDTHKQAAKLGYRCMMSHRSGETEDTSIADLVCALECGQIKAGPPRQADRTAKLNRLLWIEKQANSSTIAWT